jgi:hypothetical protein
MPFCRIFWEDKLWLDGRIVNSPVMQALLPAVREMEK